MQWFLNVKISHLHSIIFLKQQFFILYKWTMNRNVLTVFEPRSLNFRIKCKLHQQNTRINVYILTSKKSY